MSAITVKINRGNSQPILPPASGFIYVDQGNFQTVNLSTESLTIYSDSATSCIIVIVVANKGAKNTVTLAHVDSPNCIKSFFEVIAAIGADSYQIIAQGANPADNQTSIENANQLTASVAALGKSVISKQLFLLEGDPRHENRGEFGLSYFGNGTAIASNQPYQLELYQRDPTCGGQTVYCIMRRQETPPVQIRDAGVPFTQPELVELSFIAIQFRKNASDPSTAFTNIVNLQSAEILQNWSTTPEFEAPWFSDQLKLGAVFAIAMAPVVNLCGQYLNKSKPTLFTRMRQALLEKT